MMGYPESLTDPSYAGQLLTLTYPLVGNYGVPPFSLEQNGLPTFMESNRIYAHALIVSNYSEHYCHWNAVESLADWLKREHVPGVTGIDTRQLTKVLREHGVMMGRLLFDSSEDNLEEEDYSAVNWVERVSCRDVVRYNEGGGYKVVLVDCGVKANIIRCLVDRGCEVIRVPWNYDYTDMAFDGLFLANGPGDPDKCVAAVEILKKLLSESGVYKVHEPVMINGFAFTLNKENVTDEEIHALERAIRAEGTTYLNPSGVCGVPHLRCSLSNWSIEEADVEKVAAAVIAVGKEFL